MARRKPSSARRSTRRSIATPSAALLAGVFQNLTEGVFIAACSFERNGLVILHANPALCRITGYSAEELVGRPHGFMHNVRADLQALRRWFKRLPDHDAYSAEGYLRHRDGHSIYASWTFSFLPDAKGKVTHIVGTYRDMTANRSLQEALVHSQRLDAVGRLAGGVAHDFNNLLSVINGYCEILQHSIGENEKARKEVQEIHQAGQRASGLVRQLLAFGRRQALDPRVINPNRLVRENADILSRLLGTERSLELSLDDTVGNIRVDPTQLQQVLLNLVINARDATLPGVRVVITTGMRRVAPGFNRRITAMAPGTYVVLTISDNGCGMDEATQAVLFEPFFTTKDEGMGTGLGLALVYGVVQQSGGHIKVRSQLDAGTTFEVFLHQVPDEPTPSIGTLAPLPVTRGRETLLVVEEDNVVRKMVAGILTADGYDVIAQASPAAALIEVKHSSKTVHLVIADTSDPTDDTINMIRDMYRDQPELRVLCTPRQHAPAITFLPGSHQMSLAKPFALSTLLTDVRKLLDSAG